MGVNAVSMNKVSQNVTTATISPIDTETKNIMNQITNRQQRLNRLSSESEMSAEEKAKERQEIQKQIAELNRKLRMLHLEKKEEAEEIEEEQKTASEEKDEEKISQIETEKKSPVTEAERQQKKNTVSPQNIQKILEAGTILQKERIQQKVERNEEAGQNILEAEIKADELYGTDSTTKREKLHILIESKKNGFEVEGQQERRSRGLEKGSVKIVFRDTEI